MSSCHALAASCTSSFSCHKLAHIAARFRARPRGALSPQASVQVGPALMNADGKMVGQVLERLNGVSCSQVRQHGVASRC